MKIKDEINQVIINDATMKKITLDLENILKKLKKTSDCQEEKELIYKFNEIRDHYLTLYWISYIGYLQNVKDEKYLETEKIMGKYEPIINNLIYDYYSILTNSKNQEQLVKLLGKRTLAIAANQSRLKNEKIVSLQKKEKELCQEYQKLIIGTKFDFLGNNINLSSLNQYYNSDDRTLRKKAYDKRYEILEKLEPRIDKIINELIKIRTKIATELNFPSYSDMSFVKMNRLGYTKEDLVIFKKQIKDYVVPLLKLLKDEQKARLELDNLEYYDQNYLFSDGNAEIQENLSEVLNKFQLILKSNCPLGYQLFTTMLEEQLIDLENRENKSNGGITTYLPDYKMPLFIKKYTGIESNITSIFHEFGHSMQLYLSRDLLFHENRWPTFDICEIHSTSMEYLMYPFIKEFFGNDDVKYKIRHLTTNLSLMVNMAIADDFWTNIYDHPTLSNEERKQEWLKLKNYYQLNESDSHEYFQRGIEYQADTNRIVDPFYTIDYAIDNVLALSFYKKSKDNLTSAFKEYIELCKDGGSLSLKEIIDKYQLDNPFQEGALKDMCSTVKKEIKQLTLERKAL